MKVGIEIPKRRTVTIGIVTKYYPSLFNDQTKHKKQKYIYETITTK
jgi:hypothetical protein